MGGVRRDRRARMAKRLAAGLWGLLLSCPMLAQSGASSPLSEGWPGGSPEVRRGLAGESPGEPSGSRAASAAEASLHDPVWPAGVTISCKMDATGCWVSPYFRGPGGFVARAEPGAEVTFALECGNRVSTGSVQADDAGVANQLLSAGNGHDCDGRGGTLWLGGDLEAGSWSWSHGAASSAASLMIRVEPIPFQGFLSDTPQVGSRFIEPVDWEGWRKDRMDFGTWFEDPASGRTAIVPHVHTGYRAPPCRARLHLGEELDGSCTLGSADEWILGVGKVDQENEDVVVVADPGRLVLPSTGSETYRFVLSQRRGFVQVGPVVVRGWLGGPQGKPPPRGVTLGNEVGFTLSAHERCAPEYPGRENVDHGVFVVEKVVGTYYDVLTGLPKDTLTRLVPPVRPGTDMTLAVSCPEPPTASSARPGAGAGPPDGQEPVVVSASSGEVGIDQVVVRLAQPAAGGVAAAASPQGVASFLNVSCGDPGRCWVTPYFKGQGGFVVQADPHENVEFAVECRSRVKTGAVLADEEGVARQVLVAEDYGCQGAVTVYVGDVEPGGWYWTEDDGSSASAPLVSLAAALHDRKFEPVDPGGLTKAPGFAATRFLHEPSGRAVILPHLEPGGFDCYAAVAVYDFGEPIEFDACVLGESSMWKLVLEESFGVDEDIRYVDPGSLELPKSGSKMYRVNVHGEDGAVAVDGSSKRGELSGVDGAPPPRGLAIMGDNFVLTWHERCEQSSTRDLVDKGVWVVTENKTFIVPDSIAYLPPEPDGMKMTIGVSCPTLSAAGARRGVELAPAGAPFKQQ